MGFCFIYLGRGLFVLLLFNFTFTSPHNVYAKILYKNKTITLILWGQNILGLKVLKNCIYSLLHSQRFPWHSTFHGTFFPGTFFPAFLLWVPTVLPLDLSQMSPALGREAIHSLARRHWLTSRMLPNVCLWASLEDFWIYLWYSRGGPLLYFLQTLEKLHQQCQS